MSSIFPEIVYDDAPAALEWLTRAFGFVAGEVIEGPDGTIAHAELHYGAGAVMPKSRHEGVEECIYVTVDDPDAHHRCARAAGADIVMAPFDTDYGARNYCARDLEGRLWSFGTYTPRHLTTS